MSHKKEKGGGVARALLVFCLFSPIASENKTKTLLNVRCEQFTVNTEELS